MAFQIPKHQAEQITNMSDNSGGMNIVAAEDKIAENECVDATNFQIQFYGSKFRTRPALSPAMITESAPISHIWYDQTTHEIYYFVGESGHTKKIYKYNADIMEKSYIGNTTGTEDKPSCVNFNGNIFIASGSHLQCYLENPAPIWAAYANSLVTLDGSLRASDGTKINNSPLANIVYVQYSRLVVVQSNADNIYWSAIADALSEHAIGIENDDDDDTSSAKYIQGVGSMDASKIISLNTMATDLIAFKGSGKVYSITGNAPDWYVTEIGVKSNIITKDAVTAFQDNLLFAATSGLAYLQSKSTYGNYALKEFGVNINPEIIRTVSIPWFADCPIRHQLLISPNSSNVLWCYHYNSNGFTKWVFPATYKLHDAVETQNGTYIAVENSDGKGLLCMLNDDIYRDFGTTPISQIYKSRRLTNFDLMTSHIENVKVSALDDSDGELLLKCRTGTQYFANKQPYLIKDWKYNHNYPVIHVRNQIRDESLQYIIETKSPIVLEYLSESVIYNADGQPSQNQGPLTNLADQLKRR